MLVDAAYLKQCSCHGFKGPWLEVSFLSSKSGFARPRDETLANAHMMPLNHTN